MFWFYIPSPKTKSSTPEKIRPRGQETSSNYFSGALAQTSKGVSYMKKLTPSLSPGNIFLPDIQAQPDS